MEIVKEKVKLANYVARTKTNEKIPKRKLERQTLKAKAASFHGKESINIPDRLLQ